MSLDAGALGRTTAELMEHLDEEYGDDESAELVEIMVIASVRTANAPRPPDEDEEENTWVRVHSRSSEISWTRQLGLLHATILGIEDR